MGAYGLLHALYFWADPLGQSPVLDARENIAWAERIAMSELPQEPIYRALLYPLLLSLFPSSSLPVAATLFGLLMHGVSAWLVGLIGWRLWQNPMAGYLGALLYAVYPVALYFAGQVLDITFAITLFLAGVYVLLLSGKPTTRRRVLLWALLAGVVGGLAVLARPNFLPAVIGFPLAALFLAAPYRFGRALASLAGLVLALGLQGGVNYKLSGELRLMPWQGAYNLYAANRSGANGKYYTQKVSFERIAAGDNSTRMESEWLYREQAGADAPRSVAAMDAHWRAELIQEIRAAPLAWVGLMGRKTLYLFNDWEQYNNLTYAYHKARWPHLRWNPLGWGLLLIAAGGGLYFGYRRMDRPVAYALGLLILAYAAGLLLFFVSARFRLPLVPFLCIAAGGCLFLRPMGQLRPVLWLSTGLCGLALLSFGNWFEARDRTTFIQDELLLAQASSEVGADGPALELARAVLARDPQRPEAQRLEVTSLFNLWLTSGELAYWAATADALAGVESSDAAVEFIRGVVLWRASESAHAVATWRAAVARYGAEAGGSRAALQAVGAEEVAPEDAARLEPFRRILGL
ncbi:MAG: hypothetical protein EA353_05205 [Puniceicoccaceae bacterium]|nr:MAG: hypothetical protein EA353_05205 [Puniceicoccaceae bacterium]